MFYNPVDYGRKAEEVLWRKVFYDPIQLVKKNRRVYYKLVVILFIIRDLKVGYQCMIWYIWMSSNDGNL